MSKKDTFNEKEFYSYREINKSARSGLFRLGILLGLVFWALIFQGIYFKSSWQSVAPLILLLALPLSFYPSYEKWIYKAWQSKAQKYETHFKEPYKKKRAFF